MKNHHKTLEELQKRIAAAVAGNGVSLKLIAEVVAYAEVRKAEGAALDRVADELGVPTWQLADWIELANKANKRPMERFGGTLKVMVELPIGRQWMADLLDHRWLADVANEVADRLKNWAESTDGWS